MPGRFAGNIASEDMLHRTCGVIDISVARQNRSVEVTSISSAGACQMSFLGSARTPKFALASFSNARKQRNLSPTGMYTNIYIGKWGLTKCVNVFYCHRNKLLLLWSMRKRIFITMFFITPATLSRSHLKTKKLWKVSASVLQWSASMLATLHQYFYYHCSEIINKAKLSKH